MKETVMRKSLFLGAALLIGASAVAAADDFEGKPPAVKTAIQVEWAWDGGDRAEIAVPATVHYQLSGSPRVIVKGPVDLIERVRFQDGELKLKERLFGNWGNTGERLDVTITGVKLRKVGLAGKVDMDMGEIHQDELQLSIAGKGSFNASGSADNLMLNVAGSGEYHLGKLVAHSVKVSIAGSGDVDTASPQQARVSIVGSGKVHFVAMPSDISTSIIGSGHISDASGRVIDRHFGSDHEHDHRRG
jgi:hypothetical protein